jgi:hypothetical protein
MKKAAAHKAGARTVRSCIHDSSSKRPATAETNTAMTKIVGKLSDIGMARAEVPAVDKVTALGAAS